jgi:hypothetical protein
MSAFDSAMLMIDDLSKQVVELNQKVWELELALWHERQNVKTGVCTLQRGKCKFCLIADKAFIHVEEMLRDEV